MQSKVAAGVLSAGHAKAILGLATPEAMEALAHRVIAEGLSVRSTEEAVALAASDGPAPGPRKQAAAPARARGRAATSPSRCPTGSRPASRSTSARSEGKITIEFATLEDLARIAALLDNPPR